MLAAVMAAIALGSLSPRSAGAQAKSPAQAPDETVPSEQRIFMLSKAYAAIGLYFAHWQKVPNLDLDAEYRQFLRRALETSGRYDFDLLMIEYMNRLQNGHSWFRDAWLTRTRGQSLGFDFRYLEPNWVVTKSDIPQLQPGDVIEKIDDVDFETFYRANRKYTNPSSERTSRTSFPSLLFLFPQEFSLQTNNGNRFKIARTAKHNDSPVVSGRWVVPKQVAYIRMVHLVGADPETNALSLLQEFRGASALIIDVRGYAGGNTPNKLIAALMDRPYRSFGEASSVNIGLFQYWANGADRERAAFADYFRHPMLSWPATYREPEGTVFRGRLIFLVDGGSQSAKEGLLVPFKDNGRATLVGERTAGTSGQPYFFKFDEDRSIAVGAKLETFPDGSLFEGIGIQPDVEVIPTIRDLQQGRDPVLDRAMEIATADHRNDKRDDFQPN